MTVKNYVLDINKTSLQHPSIVLRQDDYNIYTVNISVTDNGTPVDLGSYTLNFLGITPAGAKIIDSKNFITNAGDLKNGKFSYRFPKEAAGSKGVYDVAYFRLSTTSGATSTIDLNLRVLGGVDLTASDVKDYITVDNTLRNTLVSEVFKRIDAKVDKHLATVKKGDKGDKGDKGEDGYMPVIGGRNLLLGTRDWTDSTRWSERGTVTENTYRGLTIAATAKAWNSPIYMIQNAGILQFGKIYTFSTYVRNTSDTDITLGYYYDYPITTNHAYSVALPAHTDWTRVSITFEVIKDPTESIKGIRWESQNTLTNGQIQFAGYKLEAGNVATDWTPAPEDVPSNDARLVHKTNNETIAGNKTLTGLTTMLTGNYGLRVTSSGFEKTTDGGKKWVKTTL